MAYGKKKCPDGLFTGPDMMFKTSGRVRHRALRQNAPGKKSILSLIDVRQKKYPDVLVTGPDMMVKTPGKVSLQDLIFRDKKHTQGLVLQREKNTRKGWVRDLTQDSKYPEGPVRRYCTAYCKVQNTRMGPSHDYVRCKMLGRVRLIVEVLWCISLLTRQGLVRFNYTSTLL